MKQTRLLRFSCFSPSLSHPPPSQPEQQPTPESCCFHEEEEEGRVAPCVAEGRGRDGGSRRGKGTALCVVRKGNQPRGGRVRRRLGSGRTRGSSLLLPRKDIAAAAVCEALPQQHRPKGTGRTSKKIPYLARPKTRA